MTDASILTLLPEGISPHLALALVVLSFFTSMLTAAAGIGGGVVLLAVLASVLPPAVAIPVHGAVQIGSNAGRAALMRASVRAAILVPFAIGSAIGVALGARLFVSLPVAALQTILGTFILAVVWLPSPRAARITERGFLVVGVVASFCSIFVGVVGPFVAALISPQRYGRHTVVATHAACMTAQHGLKVAAFGLLGFAFAPWLVLLVLMIGAGFLGTVAGRGLLERMPERAFAMIFRLILTALALRLLWQALAR